MAAKQLNVTYAKAAEQIAAQRQKILQDMDNLFKEIEQAHTVEDKTGTERMIEKLQELLNQNYEAEDLLKSTNQDHKDDTETEGADVESIIKDSHLYGTPPEVVSPERTNIPPGGPPVEVERYGGYVPKAALGISRSSERQERKAALETPGTKTAEFLGEVTGLVVDPLGLGYGDRIARRAGMRGGTEDRGTWVQKVSDVSSNVAQGIIEGIDPTGLTDKGFEAAEKWSPYTGEDQAYAGQQKTKDIASGVGQNIGGAARVVYGDVYGGIGEGLQGTGDIVRGSDIDKKTG